MLKRISLFLVSIFILVSIIGCANQEPNSDNQEDKIIFESDKEKEMVSCSIKKEIISCSRVLYVDNLGEVITLLKMRVTENKLVFLNADIELETEVISKKANVSSQGSSDNTTNNVLNLEIENEILKDDVVYTIKQSYQFSKNTTSKDMYSNSIISSSPVPVVSEQLERTATLHMYDYESYFKQASKNYTINTSEDYKKHDIFERLVTAPPYCKEVENIVYGISGNVIACSIVREDIPTTLWEVSNFIPSKKDVEVTKRKRINGYTEGETETVHVQELIDILNSYKYVYIPTYYILYNIDLSDSEFKYSETEEFEYSIDLEDGEIRRNFNITNYIDLKTTIIGIDDCFDNNGDTHCKSLVFAVGNIK